jgi:F-type H+-transporting ATPase subunit epsilon
MAKTLLRVITLDKIYFEQEVDMIIFDGQDGQIGVLPGHAPLTVALHDNASMLRAINGDDVYVFFVGGGFAKIAADTVTILTDAAEDPGYIDAGRAKRDLEAAENALKSEKDDAEITGHQYKLRRSLVRLEVSSFPIVRK